MKSLGASRRQAYRLALPLVFAVVVLLLLPLGEPFLAKGPDNTGHENLACHSCHLGRFVHRPVTNEVCLDCHAREDDRHPMTRFVQPEFVNARLAIQPHRCNSCHRQHSGRRVTATQDICQHCHGDIDVPDDPIDIAHRQLAQQRQWNTCLGCHDFHGNHDRQAQRQLAKRYSDQQIEDYFQGIGTPYGHRRLTVMQTMRLKKEE